MNFFSLIFRYRDKKSPDKLGLYPERFHLDAFPERRYLWASRILAIFAVFSFCITIILTLVVYLLLPQLTAKPSFFKINPINYNMELVEAQFKEVSLRDALSEKYITDYIKLRHEIPQSTADLFYHWNDQSLFYWYSGAANYNNFISNLDNEQLKSFIRQGVKRFVEVKQVIKLTPELWVADFITKTSSRLLPDEDVIKWRAYLRIVYLEFDKYENLEKTEEEKLNYTSNPFGFKVVKYSLAYAGKPQKAESAMQTAKKVFENLEDVVK